MAEAGGLLHSGCRFHVPSQHYHQGPFDPGAYPQSAHPSGEIVRIFCQTRPDYNLSVRQQEVVLVPADDNDPYQTWIRYESDSSGVPAFAVMNTGAGKALRHAEGAETPIFLDEYTRDVPNECILWTTSADLLDGYRAIRPLNKAHLSLTADYGLEKTGGAGGGKVTLSTWKWMHESNQHWMIGRVASAVVGEKRQRVEAQVAEYSGNPTKRLKMLKCRAGNLNCGLETGRSVLLGPEPASDCDVCCVEPGFCRECKCILCCDVMLPDDAGDCNIVRCLHRSLEGGICGHGAHLECALGARVAGVVKESKLDIEYMCRRCDSKIDLRELVTRLLEAVGNTVKRPVAEKYLQLALQIMQGTEHGGSGARVLESLVQSALKKVQRGVDIQEVFSELRDQGMAAEAAKQQQYLGRATSHGEDVPQQPEASLDQWLPSYSSPSSHPGTPSSFSSPAIMRNLSVNSPADGGGHTGVDGHTGESVEAVRSPGSKFSNPGNDLPSARTSGSPVKINSERGRGDPPSSDINHEVAYDSQPGARNGKHSTETVSRSLRSGQKGAAEVQKDEACISCGAKKPASGHDISKVEVGGPKSQRLSPTRKEVGLTTQNRVWRTYDVERITDHSGTASQCTTTYSAGGMSFKEGPKTLGISLRQLDDECQEQVQSVLQKLRLAQQAEFRIAQERLVAQKEYVLKQYELLETARGELEAAEISSSYHLVDFDRLMLKLSAQFSKASEGRQALERMLKVSGGFGRLSKEDLSKYYGWPPGREVEIRD
ncbi:hypothetical protein R1sor_027253 [Riccia sorocarpa]|uniref:Oberon PHD finger domain-containing protein n=1 Tax=Riccia sorocarpa TaxID=122646 RepID=A0ABD3GGZ1_9MARC